MLETQAKFERSRRAFIGSLVAMAVTTGVVSKVPGLESILKPLEEKKPDFIEVKSYQWKIIVRIVDGQKTYPKGLLLEIDNSDGLVELT